MEVLTIFRELNLEGKNLFEIFISNTKILSIRRGGVALYNILLRNLSSRTSTKF